MRPVSSRRSPCRGVVLVIVLIMLILVTLVGMTSVRTITLQERMVAASYDRNLAFQVAETGLREGENRIEAVIAPFVRTDPATRCTVAPDCSRTSARVQFNFGTPPNNTPVQFYRPRPAHCRPLWIEPAGPTDADSLPFESANWNEFWTVFSPDMAGGNTFAAAASSKTGYFVELMGCNFACEVGGGAQTCSRFRVTSRARGGDGRADVILQSIYATE